MIWKFENDTAQPLTAIRSISTAIGMVSIYVQSNGDVLLEITDLAFMGLFREKFFSEVLPEVRKILELPTIDVRKLRAAALRRGAMKKADDIESADTRIDQENANSRSPKEDRPNQDRSDGSGQSSI
jgi:hypothetical protein